MYGYIYMYIRSILRYEFRCIMSIHCSVGEKLLFFGIEYHFVREIKFHRELSTLENSVPQRIQYPKKLSTFLIELSISENFVQQRSQYLRALENLVPQRTQYLRTLSTLENLVPQRTQYLRTLSTLENLVPQKTQYPRELSTLEH